MSTLPAAEISSAREVVGDMSSADASGGVALTLYLDGTVTTTTIGADEYLYITDLQLVVAAGGAAGLYADSDAGGRRIAKGTYAPTGGVIPGGFNRRRKCPKGVTPKVIAPIGQVDCIIHGYIASV